MEYLSKISSTDSAGLERSKGPTSTSVESCLRLLRSASGPLHTPVAHRAAWSAEATTGSIHLSELLSHLSEYDRLTQFQDQDPRRHFALKPRRDGFEPTNHCGFSQT